MQQKGRIEWQQITNLRHLFIMFIKATNITTKLKYCITTLVRNIRTHLTNNDDEKYSKQFENVVSSALLSLYLENSH